MFRRRLFQILLFFVLLAGIVCVEVYYDEYVTETDGGKAQLRIIKPELVSILKTQKFLSGGESKLDIWGSTDGSSANAPGSDADTTASVANGQGLVKQIYTDPFGNVFIHASLSRIMLGDEDDRPSYFYPSDANTEGVKMIVIPAQVQSLSKTDEYNVMFSDQAIQSFEYILDDIGFLTTFTTLCNLEETDFFREVFLEHDTNSMGGSNIKMQYKSPMCDVVLIGEFKMKAVGANTDDPPLQRFAYWSTMNQAWVGSSLDSEVISFVMTLDHMIYASIAPEPTTLAIIEVANHSKTLEYDSTSGSVAYSYEFEFDESVPILYLEGGSANRENPPLLFTLLMSSGTRYLIVVGRFERGYDTPAGTAGRQLICNFVCVFMAPKPIGNRKPDYHVDPTLNLAVNSRIASVAPSYMKLLTDAKIDWVDEDKADLILLFPNMLWSINVTYERSSAAESLWGLLPFKPGGVSTIPQLSVVTSGYSLTELEVSHFEIRMRLSVPAGSEETNRCYALSKTTLSLNVSCGAPAEAYVAKMNFRATPEVYSENFPNYGEIEEDARVTVKSSTAISHSYIRYCMVNSNGHRPAEHSYISGNATHNGTLIANFDEFFCPVPEKMSADDPPKKFQFLVKSRDQTTTFVGNLAYYGDDGEVINSVISKESVVLTNPLGLSIGRLTIIAGVVCAIIWLVILLCFVCPCKSKELEIRRKKCFNWIYYRLFPDEDEGNQEKHEKGEEVGATTLGIFVTMSVVVLWVVVCVYELERVWNFHIYTLVYEDELSSSMLLNLKTFSVYYSYNQTSMVAGKKVIKTTVDEFRASYSTSSDNRFVLPLDVEKFDLIVPVWTENVGNEPLSGDEPVLYEAENSVYTISFDAFLKTVSHLRLNLRWLKMQESKDSVADALKSQLSGIFPSLFSSSSVATYKYALQVQEARILRREKGGGMARNILLELEDSLTTKRYDDMSVTTQLLLLLTLLGAILALRIPFTKILMCLGSIAKGIKWDSVLYCLMIIAFYIGGIVLVIGNATSFVTLMGEWKVPNLASCLALGIALMTIAWRAHFHYALEHIHFSCRWYKFMCREPFLRIGNLVCHSKTFWLWFVIYLLCMLYWMASFVVNIVFIILMAANIIIDNNAQSSGVSGTSASLLATNGRLGIIGEKYSGKVSYAFFGLDTVALILLIIVVIFWKVLKFATMVDEFDKRDDVAWMVEEEEEMEEELEAEEEAHWTAVRERLLEEEEGESDSDEDKDKSKGSDKPTVVVQELDDFKDLGPSPTLVDGSLQVEEVDPLSLRVKTPPKSPGPGSSQAPTLESPEDAFGEESSDDRSSDDDASTEEGDERE